MNAQATSTRTELANRSSDGLDVRLVWAKRDGRDEVVVSVTDFREGAYFEIPAEPARALDVYYHPFPTWTKTLSRVGSANKTRRS